jgi:hypothetical protein
LGLVREWIRLLSMAEAAVMSASVPIADDLPPLRGLEIFSQAHPDSVPATAPAASPAAVSRVGGAVVGGARALTVIINPTEILEPHR